MGLGLGMPFVQSLAPKGPERTAPSFNHFVAASLLLLIHMFGGKKGAIDGETFLEVLPPPLLLYHSCTAILFVAGGVYY